jgi:hypothetical protein
VAGVFLRSSLFGEDYRTYTSDLTVVPFRLDHPADWESRAGAASDIILGPTPAAATDLFFNKLPEGWTSVADTLRAGSSEAVWLYINALNTPYDTSQVDAFRTSITSQLPPDTQLESAVREVTVDGAPATEIEGVASDPANPQTRLRVLVDVVQPPGAGGAVLLAFFAPEDAFDDHRPTFERVRDSLEITR